MNFARRSERNFAFVAMEYLKSYELGKGAGLGTGQTSYHKEIAMNSYQTNYTNLLIQEIKATPGEYLPTLLNIVRVFRESITLKPAESSFRKGWEETLTGETMPIDELWTGFDNDR